jgi:eukaryotic-like serine/threonine-protein kinase
MTRMTEQIGRVLGGRYRLLSPLGSGASAQVYLADDVRLRRRVALKVLHPALADDESFLRRFRAEAQAAAALSHPHILAVYDWSDDDDGTPFLVTEYLAGGTLRTMLDAGHRLSPAQALVVGLEAARALDHAHHRGFVHRDIKPANLLFGADGRLRVADFGLARAIAEAGWTEPTGSVLGTARYASPEQARGETLDGRSDVYSLALVIVEAVTGDVPFTADTTIGTLMARLDHSVVVPEELGALAAVVVAAGRLDIEERLDAGGLARGLVEAAGELTRPAPLPLVGAAGETVVSLDDRDATLLGPGARKPAPANGAPAAGTGAGDLAGVAFAGPPAGTDVLAAPSAASPLAGADTTRLDVPTVAPVLRSPPDGLPAHAGAAPPWSTSHGAPGGMSPNDRSARRLMLGAAVVIIAVAVGIVGGWLYMQSQIPSHPVPAELVGMQRDALPAAIDDFDWEIRDETTRRDGTQPGQILETEPAAGEMLREGDTLRVLVSEGATLVDVPSDLAGMTGEDAAAALEAAGLVPQLVEQPSEEVDEGLVIGFADEDPGDQAPKGSTIRLAVSSGDEFAMPDLRGQPYADAVATLEGAGLDVRTDTDTDDDVEAGAVIRTDPEAGEEVEPGDRVTVVVAENRVEVPELRGDSLEEATEALEEVGLTVGQVTGPGDGRVLGTWPLEGSDVSSGTPVALMMRPRR